ncbi:MAG: 50S ribosomal protein L23 [Candidatus Doudnabacteria bacterium]|nr:50S ribosomal protein L23 [Candidatus Doudnabacteria bacterium]
MVQEGEQKPVVLKENTGLAHRILKNHHLSEKTNLFSTTGRYVFKVDRSANKIEVKKAIEKVYDVHVVKVNMLNVLGKKRKQGKVTGRTQDWKKAIVILKDGERIAGLAEGV